MKLWYRPDSNKDKGMQIAIDNNQKIKDFFKTKPI